MYVSAAHTLNLGWTTCQQAAHHPCVRVYTLWYRPSLLSIRSVRLRSGQICYEIGALFVDAVFTYFVEPYLYTVVDYDYCSHISPMFSLVQHISYYLYFLNYVLLIFCIVDLEPVWHCFCIVSDSVLRSGCARDWVVLGCAVQNLFGNYHVKLFC